MPHLGEHIIIELYGCPASLLANRQEIEKLMKASAKSMGANIVESTFHHFAPLGISGVVLIKESHLTIHTWPEHAYAAVDIFTCGTIDLKAGVHFLKEQLMAKKTEVQSLKRGSFLSVDS